MQLRQIVYLSEKRMAKLYRIEIETETDKNLGLRTTWANVRWIRSVSLTLHGWLMEERDAQAMIQPDLRNIT